MPHQFHIRLLLPTVLTGGLFVMVSVVMAISLFREQAAVGDAVKASLEANRAAADVEQNLIDLLAVLEDRVEEVGGLNARLFEQLSHLHALPDEPEEHNLVNELRQSAMQYREFWSNLPPTTSADHIPAVRRAVAVLRDSTLPRCQALRRFTRMRVESSYQEHLRVLRWMAWGMAGVGGLAAIAGIVLGYGVARGVRRTIHRMQVRVMDAAGKIGQPVSEIVFTNEGMLAGLEEQIHGLAGQIGQVVDDLQAREREVLRAEQLAAVGQLAAGVAHEIRNPLTAIKLLVQAARSDGPNAKLEPDDLEVVEREVRRMERSLQTFLDFARPSHLRRVPTDLNELVQESLELIHGRADQQKVIVKFDAPAKQLVRVVDADQFLQVLVNLLLNALDAMPTGGELQVRLEELADGTTQVTVSDTGEGISASILPRLFQPFVSGKETGLGLGLVTCQRIVEDHGGVITGENRPERGASFVVQLPGETDSPTT